MKRFICVAFAAGALAACGQDQGPAVSTSEEPRNAAISVEPTPADQVATPGANSFTEEQARERIVGAGFTNVGALTLNERGVWTGTAQQNGQTVTVGVDYQGSVVTQ